MSKKKMTNAPGKGKRRRVNPGERAMAALVADAQRAIARVVEARTRAGAADFDDVLAAMSLAGAALDLLAGSPAEPHEPLPPRVLRVRRMHRALVATTADVLDDEIANAATNIRAATPANVPRLVAAFLRRVSSHLRVLGVSAERVPRDFVPAVLGRWSEKPNARRGEVSARGVVIALLVAAGEDEDRARARVDRRRR